MRKILCFLFMVGCASGFEYKVSGLAESFTKAGFNNQRLVQGSDNDRAPTESFSTIFAQLNFDAQIFSGLNFGLGGSVGGLALDSTNNAQGKEYALTQGLNRTVVQDAFFGASFERNKAQNYVLHNAFLEHSSEHFYLKLGRYESGKVGEWFDGHTQGAEGYAKFGAFKLWAFFSNRRALLHSRLFYDWWQLNGEHENGKTRNLYAAGFDTESSGFKLSLFSYYADSKVVAPGFSLSFDTNPSFSMQGFRSITKIHALFPIAQSSFVGSNDTFGADVTTTIYDGYRNWGYVKKSTQTLHIAQKFAFDNMNFGLGYYQNFGNANALIGTFGSPLELAILPSNAYDYGRGMSDMVGANALTGYGYFGSVHGGFDWSLLARATKSDRSDEQSVALNMNYQIRSDIKISAKLEWLNDITKAGYSPYIGANKLAKKRADDKSHAFFVISHTF
ncbi:outer membrane family protein [Helicobacter jaachi]|uniref:Outer membrane family protein n=1 Tax=Helicobacter jaachi TaxID=1677920 RepID=A0A4U8TAN4_9HELI|nr:outer membrane family protein [Helicobacter jaachi]TLD96921.1 outer membrane family protein [Helicobacter jaachi]